MFLWLLLTGQLLHARWLGRGTHCFTVCKITLWCCTCICTGLSSDYEKMARINCVYFPLLFCLLNFGIGMLKLPSAKSLMGKTYTDCKN